MSDTALLWWSVWGFGVVGLAVALAWAPCAIRRSRTFVYLLFPHARATAIALAHARVRPDA